MKERFKFVDIAKGICILLIIRGHIDYLFFPEWVNENEFYTIWYVSGFYLIGGFFIKDTDLLTPLVTIKKKFSSLYLKSLYFFLPATLLHNVLCEKGFYPESIEPFKNLTDWSINLGKVFLGISFEKLVEPLWFALALFYGFIFLSLTASLLKKARIYSHINLLASTITICAISCFITNYTDIHFPPRIATALSSTLLIYVGYLIFNSKYNSFNDKSLFIISFIILLSYTYTIGAKPGYLVGMIVNEYPEVVMLLVGTIAGVYLICFISKHLECTKIGNILAYCGRESFYLMALHMMFIRSLALIMSKYSICNIQIQDYSHKTDFIGFWVLFLGSIGCTFCLLFLFRKLKTIIKL